MPHGRPKCKWEDTMKMDLKEKGYGGVEWINLAQGRVQWHVLASKVMKFGVTTCG